MPLIVGAHLSRCIILFHMYTNSRNGAAFFIAGITEQTVVYMGLTGRAPTVPLIHMCPQRCHYAQLHMRPRRVFVLHPFVLLPVPMCQRCMCPVSLTSASLDASSSPNGSGEHPLASSTSLYYISLSLGFGNTDDRHRHPNINIREIIWLGD